MIQMHQRYRALILGAFVYIIIFTVPLSAWDSKITFDHLTIKNGLSDGRIDRIIQDSYGFLWFGNQDGLSLKIFSTI